MHSEKVSTATSTSSSENRKSSKPIMEKRRRARMNASLAELKSLLLEVMKKDGNRHSKMEKADILEMTVKHLRQLQRQHFTVPTTKEDTPFITKYTMGFQECTSEVGRYLNSVAEVDTDIQARLLNHLATYISQPSTPSGHSPTPSSPTSTTTATLASAPVSRPSSVPDTPPHQSPSSLASLPSLSATSTTQLVTASVQPQPATTQIQLQFASPMAHSTSTIQSPQISISTPQTPSRPEAVVAPKQITIFPADVSPSSTTTTTSTEAAFTAPTPSGILSLDNTCPQLPTAKLLSGVQLITTRLPNGQMAFILPTNLMTETNQTTTQSQQPQTQTRPQSQSYIPIPVYAPSSSTISPLTTTVGATPGLMALLPQFPKTGITPTSNMAFMPPLLPYSQLTGVNSSISHLSLVSAESSETATTTTNNTVTGSLTGSLTGSVTGSLTGSVTGSLSGSGLSLPMKLSPSITEMKSPALLPELTKKLALTPTARPPTPTKKEGFFNLASSSDPALQQTEEENVCWRPWAR